MEKVTFGAGCFWCIEAVFNEIEGVTHVEPGYAGGHTKNPSYRDVVTGSTGHAEVIRAHYDPSVVSFQKLLEVFFKIHDPTTLNRQGNDIGTQYRSAIFYHTDAQKEEAEKAIALLNESGAYRSKIVTEVVPINNYTTAEDYHTAYYENNQDQPYCSLVIKPKLEKFRTAFSELTHSKHSSNN